MSPTRPTCKSVSETFSLKLVLSNNMSDSPSPKHHTVDEIINLCEPLLGYRPCKWQALVVYAALGDRRILLSTAPTGGGKTATFWMPAFLEEVGTTLIVVPLKDLGTQMASVATELKFSAISITRENISDEAVIKVQTSDIIRRLELTVTLPGYREWKISRCRHWPRAYP